MARAGLGESWRCLFANDFDQMKVETYRSELGPRGHQRQGCCEVALCRTCLRAWSISYGLRFHARTCHSLEATEGLVVSADKLATRSGTFWPFWKLMRGLAQDGRAPRAIVLENVCGCLTSTKWEGLRVHRLRARRKLDYKFGAAVYRRCAFRPAIAAPPLFHRLSPGPSYSGCADRAAVRRKAWHPSAVIQAHAGVRRGCQAKLDVVEDTALHQGEIQRSADLIEDMPTAREVALGAQTSYILAHDVAPKPRKVWLTQ